MGFLFNDWGGSGRNLVICARFKRNDSLQVGEMENTQNSTRTRVGGYSEKTPKSLRGEKYEPQQKTNTDKRSSLICSEIPGMPH